MMNSIQQNSHHVAQDTEQLVREFIALVKSWWWLCFDFFYQLFYGILVEHATQWITIEACDGISTVLSWLLTAFLFFRAGLFIVQTLGKILKWCIDLIFVKSVQWIKQVVTEVVKRAFQTLWFLITFLPKSLWQSVTGKS